MLNRSSQVTARESWEAINHSNVSEDSCLVIDMPGNGYATVVLWDS